MNPLYVDAIASSVQVEDQCLKIRDLKTGKTIEKIKPRECSYDSIIIHKPNGNISFKAIEWMISNAISFTILNWKGDILAQVIPSEPVSNVLKIAQYEAFKERKMRFSIARAIIETKIQRQSEFLRSLSSSYEIEVPKAPKVSTNSFDFLRNIEARYASSYFDEYGKVIRTFGQSFEGRGMKDNRRANNLINALMNYGYAVLQTYVHRAINASGLDSTIGFLHEFSSDHPLIFDVMELWRTTIDFSVIQTLEYNKRIRFPMRALHPDNFEIRLSHGAASLLFQKIRFNLPLEEIISNVRLLARFLLKEESELRFSLRPIEVREAFETDQVKLMVLSKSYRELGMNKSSHWYQRKQLQERGSLKLYSKSKQYYS